jgi:hypothetical protein
VAASRFLVIVGVASGCTGGASREPPRPFELEAGGRGFDAYAQRPPEDYDPIRLARDRRQLSNPAPFPLSAISRRPYANTCACH